MWRGVMRGCESLTQWMSRKILEEAKKVQLKSATAIAKSSALVAEMETMGG